MGGFTYCISSEMDIQTLFVKIQTYFPFLKNVEIPSSAEDGSNMFLAYLLTLSTGPLRSIFTIIGTPVIAKIMKVEAKRAHDPTTTQ